MRERMAQLEAANAELEAALARQERKSALIVLENDRLRHLVEDVFTEVDDEANDAASTGRGLSPGVIASVRNVEDGIARCIDETTKQQSWLDELRMVRCFRSLPAGCPASPHKAPSSTPRAST